MVTKIVVNHCPVTRWNDTSTWKIIQNVSKVTENTLKIILGTFPLTKLYTIPARLEIWLKKTVADDQRAKKRDFISAYRVANNTQVER